MPNPLLGVWDIDVPPQPKPKARTVAPLCTSCGETIAPGTLRLKWNVFDDPAGPPRCYHLDCAVSAGKGAGKVAKVSRATIRKSTGLTRGLKDQLDDVLDGSLGSSAGSAEKGSKKGTKDKKPATKGKTNACVLLSSKSAKTVKDKITKVKLSKASAGGNAKTSAAKSSSSGPIAGSGGSARHLAGIVPSTSYMPIKDFVRLVTPSGTAREVFENETVKAFRAVGPKWGAWLSKEAQKVAGSIMAAGNNGKLSAQQVYVIVLYTLDVRMAGGKLENNFYYNLNPALQKRDIGQLKKIEGYLYYFMGALEALRKEKEKVYYRGVPKSAFEVVKRHYALGRRIHWSGISSVSEVKSVSVDFARSEGPIDTAGGAGGIVLRITARSGRKIQHLSAIPSESEVLLLPNWRAIVTRGLYMDGDLYAVDMVEEPDDASTFVF